MTCGGCEASDGRSWSGCASLSPSLSNRIPLVPLAVAFGVGIAAGMITPVSAAWTLWSSALAGGAGLVVLDRARWAWVPLLIGVVALGAARAADLPGPPDDIARLALPRQAQVIGRVVREPTRYAPD